MWCSGEMIINTQSESDIKQQPLDGMRTERIIILSLAQKPRITTCCCLYRGFVPYSPPAEHFVSCWRLSHGTGATAVLPRTLTGGCCGSHPLVCLAILPRDSEVWGQEREATVCLRLSLLQGGFQPGYSHGAGVQTCLWACMDTPAHIGLLPVPTLYFVAA